MKEDGFAGKFADDWQLNQTRDLMKHPQYINATHAVMSIETDKGGLPLRVLWAGTEWMREQMLRTNREVRPFIVPELYIEAKKIVETLESKCVERSVMCIMMLFALRLVTASHSAEDNPNAKVIRAIVRVLTDKMKENEERMEEMKHLLQIIDKDGDENERDGTAVVQMGVDILADDADLKVKLRVIVEFYKEKADKILDRHKYEAFDAVWEDLLDDSRFLQEMRHGSLEQEFNLLLLFNVYGLMYPEFYNTQCRGALSIAKTVGYNQKLKNKYHCYSKDYFNKNEIAKLKYGFKTDELLEHVKSILEKYK